MSGLLMLGRRTVVLGAKWSAAASILDVLASRDSLRKGDQGEAVSHIQRFLGIYEDGKYGPDTESAVAAFQDAHVTDPHQRGVVNAATFRAIAALGPGRATPAGPSQPRSGSAEVPIANADRSISTEPTSMPTWKKVFLTALAAVVILGVGLSLRSRE